MPRVIGGRRYEATPVDPAAMRMYDRMDPLYAALAAWNQPGEHPEVHDQARKIIHQVMPLLGRALIRAEQEHGL